MSDFIMKDETGSLFRNDKREKDTHPTHKGAARIDGVEYWISAWVNEVKSDPSRKYFGLKFQRKDNQAGAGTAAPPQQESFDDDVPF